MADRQGWKRRGQQAAGLAAATAMLSAVALWNGYPLVWPDTGAYIYPINLVFRSVFYNFLVAPLTWAGSLWPIVFFQSLLVAYVVRLVIREVFGEASPRTFLAVMLGTAALTSLPWETGFVMADVYAGVVVLAVFLLAFRAAALSRGERLLVSAILLAASSVHLTHPPLGAGLLALIAVYRWASRGRSAWPLAGLLRPAVPIALSIVLIVGNNAIVHREMRYSAGGYAFTLARLVADGPAIDYLRETCPVQRYALCAYLDGLPRDSDQFLWSEDSPFQKLGGFTGYRKEGREIVNGTIWRYPGRVVSDWMVNGIRQLIRIRTGSGLVSYLDKPWPTREIRAYFPADYKAYGNSRQSQGTVRLRRLWRIHSMAFAAGMLASAGVLPWLARHGRLKALLLVVILSGYGLNAFLVVISAPSDRYGARVAWMIPFFFLAWAASATASWRKGDARIPDRAT